MPVIAAPFGRLAEYREELLHDQSPAETRRMRLLAGRLRRLQRTAGLTRRQLAERAGLDLELIVAVENGLGRVESAECVLAAARAGVADR